MQYLLFIVLIIAAIYPLSYAKYNWKKKRYMQFIGVIIMVAAMLLLPIISLLNTNV